MGDFHELGLEGINRIVDSHHFDKGFDYLTGARKKNKQQSSDSEESDSDQDKRRIRERGSDRQRQTDRAPTTRGIRSEGAMYSNGYAQRPRSQPARGGGYDSEDDSGSDYDEHSGRRRRGGGGGGGGYKDNDMVRETYEKERYRGVSCSYQIATMVHSR